MLTKRQKEVLDFVKKYKEKKGYAPSLEEIKKHLKLSSVSTAHYHISKLEESGYLEKHDNQSRAIDVKENIFNKAKTKIKELSFSVPVYGMVNAGPATIFAEENLHGYIKVPANMSVNKKNIFALQVDGDSMNKAKINGKNIENGDFVLIDPEYRNPRNGDYVLSIIDNCANIKKFEIDQKTGAIKLVSESTKDYKPIYISSHDNYMVNGKVINVIKK